MRGVGAERLNGLWLIIQQHIAVGIGNKSVGTAVGEHAVVDKRAVRLRHLAHGDAVCELAERHWRVCAVIRHKAREAQLLGQPVVGNLRGDLIDYLSSDGVNRVLKRGIDIDNTEVPAAVV